MACSLRHGGLSCEYQSRPGYPLHVLGKALPDFLEEFTFATAGVIAQHLDRSKHTIKEILQRELGLWRFSRRYVLYSHLEAQKADRPAMADDLLSVLYHQVDYSFSRILTDNELWFLYWCLSGHMFSASRNKVIPREKTTIRVLKVILTISSTVWVWSL
jgi:hypothetical protein